MQEVASWERPFQVWQYSVSHATLLLRSVDPQYDTRIDVRFPAVSLMHLQPDYDSLTIHKITEEEGIALLGESAVGRATHGTLYLLNQGLGYVRSAPCRWHEDRGDHKTPSAFGPLRGTD
ncbi:hypothetical protein [Streptomyces zagrosensis]|uniref:Uncharacterized protein n=1 Tax=Streptomyces zagrosensis TaxID=1042984 RepID=A0A7W9QF43_9ACTN|nr:hypothetical protein [Streptomyces zagrosensis]MBB5938067.1 hypothetical protein [Streptomyces zagrosensis]